MKDEFSVKDTIKSKKADETREGYPMTVSFSSWAMCPWKIQCFGKVDSELTPNICLNYEPQMDKYSLKCNNYKTKEMINASIPRQKSIKPVRKRQPKA